MVRILHGRREQVMEMDVPQQQAEDRWWQYRNLGEVGHTARRFRYYGARIQVDCGLLRLDLLLRHGMDLRLRHPVHTRPHRLLLDHPRDFSLVLVSSLWRKIRRLRHGPIPPNAIRMDYFLDKCAFNYHSRRELCRTIHNVWVGKGRLLRLLHQNCSYDQGGDRGGMNCSSALALVESPYC